MSRLPEVEEAVTVMTEGAEWSVMKWLGQKKRVRKIADRANAALTAREDEVKRGWSAELCAAYAKSGNGLAAEITTAAQRVRQADEEARRAHEEAEATFDEAERQLSARLAREGCRQAIRSWELHEKAIHKAESAIAGRKP